MRRLATGEPERPKRLTDELDDWLNDGDGGISLEEARRVALSDATAEFGADDPTKTDIKRGDWATGGQLWSEKQ